MADKAPNQPEKPSRDPRLALASIAGDTVAVDVLERNVFRGLGLGVLATGREVAKRIEEFRLARELESEIPRWALAPARIWSAEQIRAGQQVMHDPARRLLAEIFWFWPLTYPETGDDPALAVLKLEDVASSVTLWADRQTIGDPTAFHNLAVYHLLMAIEQERANASADERVSWWSASLRFWQLTCEQGAFWQRLEARVVAMADPQLPVSAVGELRKVFLDALGGINAGFALLAAEADDEISVARQRELLVRAYGSPEQVELALARAGRNLVQRIDAQISEATRAMEASGPLVLTIVRALCERSGLDIQHLNTLCGVESPTAVEVANRAANLLLDVMASLQRTKPGHPDCLIVLAYARALPCASDVKRRLDSFFSSTLDQALRVASAASAEPAYARFYTIVTESLLVDWQTWEWASSARQAIADQIADLLREVAHHALLERDDIAFALHAYHVLLQLPTDAAGQERREAERDRLQKEFLLRSDRAVSLTSDAVRLHIDHRGLRLNDQQWKIEQITALRYGSIFQGMPPIRRWVVAFRFEAEEIVLDERNLFIGETAAENHAKVVRALEFFVVPQIVDRVTANILGGNAVRMDQLEITRDGILIPVLSRLLKKPLLVPHKEFQHRTENDAWSVSAGENGQWRGKYLIVDTWNAVIMGRVIAALAEEADA